MEKINQLLNRGFESSCYKTPEFLSFSRKFKNAIKKELSTIGSELTAYNTGHFYVSGFFRTKKDNQCFYFSLSDVRSGRSQPMLYRTAKDEKDYTGGGNEYVELKEGMFNRIFQ